MLHCKSAYFGNPDNGMDAEKGFWTQRLIYLSKAMWRNKRWLSGIWKKIAYLLDKHPVGKHSTRMSHYEKDQNLEDKTRGQIEKISPLLKCKSQGNLIPFIVLIYLQIMRTRQKVSYIPATKLWTYY